MIDKFYRFEAHNVASKDMDGEFVHSVIPNVHLYLSTYSLVKETPKGYWICSGNPDSLRGKGIWVSKTSRKRYAYPTEEEALNNFIKRTERCISILEYQLLSAKIALSRGQDKLYKKG